MFDLENREDYEDIISEVKLEDNIEVDVRSPDDLDFTGRISHIESFVYEIFRDGKRIKFIYQPEYLLSVISYGSEDMGTLSYDETIDEFEDILNSTKNSNLTTFQKNIRDYIYQEFDKPDDYISFYNGRENGAVSINGFVTEVEWIEDGKDVSEKLFEHMSEEEYNDGDIPRYQKAAEMIMWYNMMERNK